MFRFCGAGKNPCILLLLPLLPAALLCGPAHADIYRVIDADSHVVYTDIRPTFGRFEVIQRTARPAPAESLAYAPRFDIGGATRDPTRYASHIKAAAAANNIDAALIRAVISAESGYNPDAVSRKGAVGLMQLMPETARRYNVTNPHDPEQNIHGGARYLSDLMQMFDHNPRLAVAAYNAGEQAVIKYGNRIPPFRETLEYVPKVLKSYERDRSGLAPAEASHYRRPASKGTISYRHTASSTAGVVRYQHVASSGTVSHQRTATAMKKTAARRRSAVIYLSNLP